MSRIVGFASLRGESTVAALVALGLGSLLLAIVGFAGPEALHEAAHDTRHGFAFPCH